MTTGMDDFTVGAGNDDLSVENGHLYQGMYKVFKKIFAVAALIGASALVLSACGSSSPKTLIGHWKQQSNTKDGIHYTADITRDQIKIWLKLDGIPERSAPDYEGTFNTSQPPTDGLTIMSKSQINNTFASVGDTKKFTYKNGELVFLFSIYSVDDDEVHMVKNSD
jgi:hypothetical protein